MRVQVLHVRNPDSAGWTRVFVDGVEVEFSEENIDAGAGWDAETWNERIRDAEAEDESPMRDATLEALHDPPGSEFISGWGD